jgi:hypothetical protein
VSVVEDFEADNSDLPRLEGTPAQIEWARAIRARAYPFMDAAIGYAISADEQDRGVRQRFVRIALAFLEYPQAAWWIDRRQHLESRGVFMAYVIGRAQEEINEERHARQTAASALAGRPVSHVA